MDYRTTLLTLLLSATMTCTGQSATRGPPPDARQGNGSTAKVPAETLSEKRNPYPVQRDPSFTYRNHYPRLAPSVTLEGLVVSVNDKMLGYQGGAGTNTTFYYETVVLQDPDGFERVFVNPGPSTLRPRQRVAISYAPLPDDFTFSDFISLYSESGVFYSQKGLLQGDGIITQYDAVDTSRHKAN